ncbi:hypothetical protein [Sphingobium lignivorans]|uniref:Uncharacterized protein n=1 Tax=Sphingobium lignivorans TaxID=2735886 RepID=A0ABR6NL86_9SPHN|nr:hypothetical protein [Sphingobium lignivorans]MBB5987442.1 hypothetical protein [Sphingobium lignivorans]
MIARTLNWLHVMLIALDRLAQTIIFGLPYMLGLGPKPMAKDSISAVVGRSAIAGRRWALIAERIIDWIFERLGEPPGHCRRAVAQD